MSYFTRCIQLAKCKKNNMIAQGEPINLDAVICNKISEWKIKSCCHNGKNIIHEWSFTILKNEVIFTHNDGRTLVVKTSYNAANTLFAIIKNEFNDGYNVHIVTILQDSIPRVTMPISQFQPNDAEKQLPHIINLFCDEFKI